MKISFTSVALFVVGSIVGAGLLFSILKPRTSGHDKPIIVSGGSLWVDSVADYATDSATQLLIQNSGWALRKFSVYTTSGDALQNVADCTVSDNGWQIMIPSHNLSIHSDGNASVIFDVSGGMTFLPLHLGNERIHSNLGVPSQISVTGASCSSAGPYVCNAHCFVAMHYCDSDSCS